MPLLTSNQQRSSTDMKVEKLKKSRLQMDIN